MDCYDWRGRLLDEPDHLDTYTLRRHCSCGSFLPIKPREVRREIPTKVDYVYDSQGNSSVVVLECEEEIDDTWTCTKCGKEYEASEMYQ